MERECSLPNSHESATYPYPEADRAIPCLHSTSWRPVLVLSSHLCPVSFPRASSPEPSTYRRSSPSQRPLWMVRRNTARFCGEELLAPLPTTKLEDHPLSDVRDCLFCIFAPNLWTTTMQLLISTTTIPTIIFEAGVTSFELRLLFVIFRWPRSNIVGCILFCFHSMTSVRRAAKRWICLLAVQACSQHHNLKTLPLSITYYWIWMWLSWGGGCIRIYC